MANRSVEIDISGLLMELAQAEECVDRAARASWQTPPGTAERRDADAVFSSALARKDHVVRSLLGLGQATLLQKRLARTAPPASSSEAAE